VDVEATRHPFFAPPPRHLDTSTLDRSTTMNDDFSLSSDTTTPDLAPTVAAAADPIALVKPKAFTVDEVLATARRIERTASICLRGDLQAEWDHLLDELSGLVTASGELIEQDSDDSLGEVSGSARVQQITERLTALRREMAEAMWRVRFRGMASEDWAPWVKKNKPKGDNANMSGFFNLLIAETAIEPTLTVEQVQQLRGVLTDTSIGKLTTTAWEACTTGGLDVPKLPISLARIAAGHSGT
jgi:hypothetical protein